MPRELAAPPPRLMLEAGAEEPREPFDQASAEFAIRPRVLTEEQATQIRENFDVRIAAGTHLFRAGTLSDSSADLLFRPGEKEYNAVAGVVATMRPGDVLFRENYGFSGPPPEPIEPPRIDKKGADPLDSFVMGLLLSGTAVGGQSQLEDDRAQRRVSAWQYAEGLAISKGVRVEYADLDRESLLSLTHGKGLMELALSSDEEDRALLNRINPQRSIVACNTLLDWALQHLPPHGRTSTPSTHKAQLVLLFGEGHVDELQQSFVDSGLPVDEVTILDRSDIRERGLELFDRDPEAATRAMGDLLMRSLFPKL